ncbi:MAG: hypothetical protein RJQ21_17850 [Rhodospirillales bacterium]
MSYLSQNFSEADFRKSTTIASFFEKDSDPEDVPSVIDNYSRIYPAELGKSYDYLSSSTIYPGLEQKQFSVIYISNKVIYPKNFVESDTLAQSIEENWQRLASSNIDIDLFKRILMFSSMSDGWRGEGSKALSPKSLKTFLEFWRDVNCKAKKPNIALSPRGNVYAEWHKSWKKHLDIEFMGDGSALFGLLDGASIVEGRETVNNIVSLVLNRKEKPLLWS